MVYAGFTFKHIFDHRPGDILWSVPLSISLCDFLAFRCGGFEVHTPRGKKETKKSQKTKKATNKLNKKKQKTEMKKTRS